MKMNDEHVERLLKESWSAPPPEGMRERVLRRANTDATRRQMHPPWLAANRWRLVLAGIWIGLVLLCGWQDQARQTRIAALVGGGSGRVWGVRDLNEWRHGVESVLAMASSADRGKGDDSL